MMSTFDHFANDPAHSDRSAAVGTAAAGTAAAGTAAAPSRRQRRVLLRKMRDFGYGYVRLADPLMPGHDSHNPCRINDGALLDLKSRQHASTHARRCLLCACPLYREELCCPFCGHKRVFFGMS